MKSKANIVLRMLHNFLIFLSTIFLIVTILILSKGISNKDAINYVIAGLVLTLSLEVTEPKR